MKRGIFLKWSVGVASAALALGITFLPRPAGSSPEQPTAVGTGDSSTNASPVTTIPPTGQTNAVLPPQAPEEPVSTGAVKPVSTEKPLPANIRPSGPAAEIIRLAESGVEESVMLAFVTNSTSTFNLGAEDIIYLNDIGVPSGVVSSMLQHDQELKQNSAFSAAPPPTPPTSSPAEVAPQPVESAPPVAEAPVEAGPPAQPGYSEFYNSLAPYGNWVDVAGYGVCWQPNVVVVDTGWRPYFNCGHWVYTDCGWYWLSDYSWGWAPFHYGRWFRHAGLGWCWAPDHVWGPCWVSWRFSNEFCGWAPLPPAAVYRPGVGFIYHGRSVGFSFKFGIGVESYAFIPFAHFSDHHLDHYAVPHDRAVNIYHNTMVVNRIVGDRNTVINNGIPSDRVAAATHRNVRQLGLRQVSPADHAPTLRHEGLSADGRTLNVFRPNPAPSTAKRAVRMGGIRSDESSVGRASAPPVNPYRSAPATAEAPVRRGEPLILRGPDRAAQGNGNGTAAGPTWPRNYGYPPVAANENQAGYNGYAPGQRQYQHPPQAYQAPPRPAPVEVPRYQSGPAERPRYEPGQGYAPQRSFNPPAQEHRAAPAPAPSAPSAPSRSAPQPSQPSRSERNGR